MCYFFCLIDIALAVNLNGNFIQGGLIFGKTDINDTVFYNGNKVPTDERGQFLLGLDRNHPSMGEIKNN